MLNPFQHALDVLPLNASPSGQHVELSLILTVAAAGYALALETNVEQFCGRPLYQGAHDYELFRFVIDFFGTFPENRLSKQVAVELNRAAER